jgi:hypothetical protein
VEYQKLSKKNKMTLIPKTRMTSHPFVRLKTNRLKHGELRTYHWRAEENQTIMIRERSG